MKSTLKRFLSLVLCMCMVFALLPNVTMTAFAASSGEVTGLSNEDIGLSYSGTADNAWNASGTTIIGSATSEIGGCGDTHDESTLNITNKKATTATLSFDYSVTLNSGTIQVAGSQVTTNGAYSAEVAVGESVKIYIKSGSAAATTITISNITLVSDVTATTTFEPAENGSYTVNGNAITESYSNTQSSTVAYQVAATAADGYRFLGWYNVTTGKCIDTNAMAYLNIESDCTITAKFALQTAAVFETGGQPFADLGDAASYAQSNSQTLIKLVSDGEITGNYTIPAGITLLIPFDAAGTLYTTTPAYTTTQEAPQAYHTLVMTSGSTITVDGSISVGGKHFTSSNTVCCKPTGAYGMIKVEAGSSIMLNDGANLYAWGYITGDGNVIANSGASVYEYYQVTDWRGGGVTGDMAGKEQKVFPFSQYYVQNIEAPLTIRYGANEYVYISVTARIIGTKSATIPFVGSNGLFKPENGGQFTKTYIPETDRMEYEISGNASLNSIALSVAGASVDSKDYVLPITNNVDIVVKSGKTTIAKDAALLPGVTVTVEKDAELNVASGASLFVYDKDQWSSSYVWGSNGDGIQPVPYSPSGKGSRSTADVKIDVNGTLTSSGNIYTTEGGADICSSEGTGMYVQEGVPGTATVTYQYNQTSSQYIEIPITPAKLHNADGSYTETASAAAGGTIAYANGKWGANAAADVTITFDANGGEGTMESQVFTQGTDTQIHANVFTRENYTFTGWNTVADGSGATYADQGSLIDLTEDLTLYAQWKFTTGWLTDEGGTTYYLNGEVAYHSQWQTIDGNTYYFNEGGYIAKGIYTVIPQEGTEEARCVFDNNGVFQSKVTGVYSVGEDTYWLNSGIIEEEAGLKRVVKDNGEVNYYYFAVQENLEEREGLTLSAAVKGSVLDGKDCWLHKTNGLALPEWGYYFDENGVILHDEDTSKNGILKDGENLYYYVDGIKAPAGMIKIDDDYYYANSKGQLIVNQTYYCSRTNGLMEEGTYAFDAEGKLVQGATDKNGIVKDDDGVLRYYVNGKVTYVGLIEIDGDFYYVRSSGEVVTDCVYWITWTHGLKEAGYYTFDENGKLTGTPKNGIVEEEDVLHYYVNGKLTYAGLIKIGDDYYYVNSKCEVVRDCDYYISWTHDLLPKGRYHFDTDGKMTGEVAPLKNGIYEEDGSLYFYRNGERAYAGLIQIDGDYYYVRSTCEVVHDRSYYVYWTHGLMPEGYYNFDSAGRMILDSETE